MTEPATLTISIEVNDDTAFMLNRVFVDAFVNKVATPITLIFEDGLTLPGICTGGHIPNLSATPPAPVAPPTQ